MSQVDISTKDEGDFHFVRAWTTEGLEFLQEAFPETEIEPNANTAIAPEDARQLYYAATTVGLTVEAG